MEFMGDADWHEINYVQLSSQRAQACVNYLIKLGVDSARLLVTSRLNEKSVQQAELDTPGIVKHKERQRLFNYKECNVVCWPINWKYKERTLPQ